MKLLAILLTALFAVVAYAAPTTKNTTTGGSGASTSAGLNYYVDATLGSDSNTGRSTGDPWQTIAKIENSRLLPKDTVLLKRGETWSEQLDIPASGAAGKPITFSAYGTGADPIIDGGGVRASGIDTSSNSYLVIGNIQLEDHTSQGILVSCGTVSSPTDITIDNVTVTDQDTYGIFIGNSGATYKTPNNVTIKNSTIEYWHRDYMVAAAGTVTAPGIYQPEADGTGGDNLTIQSNTFTSDLDSAQSNNDRNAIQIQTGNNILIEYNELDTVEHGIYIIGANHADGSAEEYTIRYNYIHDTRDDFIWLKGVTATKAGSLVAYNLLVNSVNDNGIQFQACGSDSYGTVVNNVVYGTYNAAIYAIFGLVNTVFKNNIVMNYGLSGSAGEEAVRLSTGTPTYGAGSEFDNNLYYKSGDSTPFWETALGSRTLAQWQSDMSDEASSLNEDPTFTTPGSDFTLDTGSPAINTGVDVSLTRDFLGNPIVGLPDMGAYEVQ